MGSGRLTAPGVRLVQPAKEALALAALGAETCVVVGSLIRRGPSRAGVVVEAMRDAAGIAVSMSFQHMEWR